MQSALSEQRRQAYLKALGINVWVRREPGHVVVDETHHSHHQTVEESLSDFIHSSEIDEIETVPTAPGRSVEQPRPVTSEAKVATAITETDLSHVNWHDLQNLIAHCQQCVLHAGRKQAIIGAGNLEADYLVIGDAPCSEADRNNTAFAGASAQLLQNMLNAISIDHHSVYYTNAVNCRPPADRAPKTEELEACSAYLLRQIQLLKPKAILLLGKTTAQHLLQNNAPISQLRGKVHHLKNSNIPVVISYAPKYLLVQKGDKRKAWEDLKLFRSLTDS